MTFNQSSRSSSEILENIKAFLEDAMHNTNELKATIEEAKQQNKMTPYNLGKLSNLEPKIKVALDSISRDTIELAEIIRNKL